MTAHPDGYSEPPETLERAFKEAGRKVMELGAKQDGNVTVIARSQVFPILRELRDALASGYSEPPEPRTLTPCWFCGRGYGDDYLIAGYDTWDEQRLACLDCDRAIHALREKGWLPSGYSESGMERWIESLHEDVHGLVWTTKAELRQMARLAGAGLERDREAAVLADALHAARYGPLVNGVMHGENEDCSCNEEAPVVAAYLRGASPQPTIEHEKDWCPASDYGPAHFEGERPESCGVCNAYRGASPQPKGPDAQS